MSLLEQQFSRQLLRPGKTGVDWYLFHYFLKSTSKLPAIEFGVGNGGSLITMVGVNSNVTAVDNWKFNWKKEDIAPLLETLGKNVKWIDKDSSELTLDELSTYGFVHLDANKSFEGTIKDLDLSSKICSEIICVDDYMNSLWPEVTWAVDTWLETNNWKRVLVGNHQVFLSNKYFDIKELVITTPIIQRFDTWYISYGQFDPCVNPFIDNGRLTHSWHTTSTSTDHSEW
jgi:hypothetical protein